MDFSLFLHKSVWRRFTPHRIRSARLSFQSSEVTPLLPPPLGPRVEAHSLASEGVGDPIWTTGKKVCILWESVALLPSPLGSSGETHSLAVGRVRDPIPTKVQTLWYSMTTIISLRFTQLLKPYRFWLVIRVDLFCHKVTPPQHGKA